MYNTKILEGEGRWEPSQKLTPMGLLGGSVGWVSDFGSGPDLTVVGLSIGLHAQWEWASDSFSLSLYPFLFALFLSRSLPEIIKS